MRTTFINTLIDLAKKDESIFLITPDLGFSVFERFIDLYPERFLNVGIAEQNSISIAAGLALTGYKPYVYSIVPFITMRCFEQVRVDVAYMNTNVKLIGVGGGLSYGPAGATHHAIEDIAVMRVLPNMTVCCPGDPVEAKGLILDSHTHIGPMYIRLGKNNEPKIHLETEKISFGKASILRDGKDFAVFVTGNMLETALRWTNEWVAEGLDPLLVSMHTVKPLDYELINRVVSNGIPILTLEEHNVIGGLGEAVASYVAQQKKSVQVKIIGIKDTYSHYVGSQQYLRTKFGLADKPVLDF